MIICAAIMVHIKETDRDCVLCGIRHGNCYSQIEAMGLKYGKDYRVIQEGFMDNFGNFFSREGAFNIAIENGQLSASTRQLKKERQENELYSEDLY